MMSSKQIVEEFFLAIPKRDFERVRQLMHPEYTFMGANGEHHTGIDAGIEVGEMYVRAFPDLNIEIKNMYEAGNVVVTEFIGGGTHQGEIFGVAPTGRMARVPVCNVIELREGKIYAEREYFDTAHMLKQLGVESRPQAAAL